MTAVRYSDLSADLAPIYSSGYSGAELADFDLMDEFDSDLTERLAARGLHHNA